MGLRGRSELKAIVLSSETPDFASEAVPEHVLARSRDPAEERHHAALRLAERPPADPTPAGRSPDGARDELPRRAHGAPRSAGRIACGCGEAKARLDQRLSAVATAGSQC